jgi:drug/metabolite transporter (DMT)-like permease
MNMFVGEFCCLFAFLYVRSKNRKEYGSELSPDEKAAAEKGRELEYNHLWLSIPAYFDILSTTFMYIGLTMVAASVFQIISCTILVWCGLFSYIYLGRRYKLEQYLGLFFLFSGVVIVSIATTTNSDNSSPSSPLGVFLEVIAMIFAGLLMVSEEKVLNKFHAHPLQLVGVEGATGLTFYTFTLIAMYFIPCTHNPKQGICPYGIWEDVPAAVMEMSKNGTLIFWVIVTIISLGTFNFFGVSLTYYASATHRAAVNAIRPFVVWGLCLAIGWEKFLYLQLIGYIVAVYGMLLYYGIVPLNPFKSAKSDETEESPGETKKMLTSS